MGGLVTHIDWSQDASRVQINTQQGDNFVIQAPNGTLEKRDFETIWQTWTLVNDDCVRGIWPKGSTEGDVNACHVANSGKAFVSGDDFETVNLHRFPALSPQSR